MTSPISQLTLVALAAVLAPVLAELSGRLAIPGVVLEILLGVLLGPQVLGWTTPNGLLAIFSGFGLAFLMFLAGAELDLARLRGRPIKLAGASWLASLALAGLAGVFMLIGGHPHGGIVTWLALSTTALGTLLPILRDNDILDTPLGRHVLAVGSLGEFGPIVLVALVLSGKNPGLTGLLLLAFGALAVLSGVTAAQPWGRHVTGIVRRGLHASSQLPVRLSLLLIMLMVFLAGHLGLDVLLGSFAAGVIVRVAVAGKGEDRQAEIFQGKLEAVGFGFLVPIFFIVSGMRLDLSTFSKHPAGVALIPLYLALLLLVRGLPVLLIYRDELPGTERQALALMAATGLPLIVVITALGQSDGYLSTEDAAALVTAGMLSVLLLPTAAIRLLRRKAALGAEPHDSGITL